jgi:hypothetical protein
MYYQSTFEALTVHFSVVNNNSKVKVDIRFLGVYNLQGYEEDERRSI